MTVVSTLIRRASMLERRPIPESVRRIVRDLPFAARAGLRSVCKGANKPRRIAAFRPSPGPGAAGLTATALSCACGIPRGRADRLTRDLKTVATISAEPTRRDFLYIATGA